MRTTLHLLFAAIPAALSACSSPSGPSINTDSVFRIGNGGEPKSLDPHVVTGVIEDRILSALFEGLVNLDLETLKPIPGVAESWSISDDGTVYTFHLRQDARWSNDNPVTAHDFAYAWERILTPALAAEYAYMLYVIRNAEAYNTGAIGDFSEVGVKAPDEHTLEVTLRAPTPYFLSLQIHFAWYPVHRPTIERFRAFTDRNSPWIRPENFVGNGPFRLREWSPNARIVVTKNPAYWDRDNVRLNEIWFLPYSNALTEERAFRAGDLDLTYTVPYAKIAVYQHEHPELIRIDPYLGTEFIRFNTTRPPFNDARVRRAFSMAIDRETLVNRVMRGGQKPAYAFVPPGTAGYTSTYRVAYDPPAARELLAEAGYPNGGGFPTVELLFDTGDNQRIYVEALQHMWKEALGVDVALRNQDHKTWLTSMISLDYDLARSFWIGDYVDPSNFLEMFYANSGNNRTGFASKEYEALLRRAAYAIDDSERNDLYRAAEELLLSDAPIVPVYFHTRPYLKSPRVLNLVPNILGRISYKDLALVLSE